MADHVLDALVSTGSDALNIEGSAQVFLEDWRGAGDGLGIDRGHGVPQIRSGGLGTAAFDKCVPVIGLLAPPRTERLDQPSAAQMVLLAALGTARLGGDVQGGSRHRMVGSMFDFQTYTGLSSESQTFMIERIKRTMPWLPRAARPPIPRAPGRR